MLLLKRVLMAKLAEHGVELEIATGGPIMRGIDQELVREEFYQQTPADGTERQKQDFRRKRFARTINRAIEKRLIGMREIGPSRISGYCLINRTQTRISKRGLQQYNLRLADTSITIKIEVSAGVSATI